MNGVTLRRLRVGATGGRILQRKRGHRKFVKLYVPRKLRDLARTQDKTGRRNFTEDEISKCFGISQRRVLKASGASLIVDSWLKAFISKLIAMIHTACGSLGTFPDITAPKGKLVLDLKAKLFKGD